MRRIVCSRQSFSIIGKRFWRPWCAVAAFPPNFGALWGAEGSHKLGWKKVTLLAELCKLPGQAGLLWRPAPGGGVRKSKLTEWCQHSLKGWQLRFTPRLYKAPLTVNPFRASGLGEGHVKVAEGLEIPYFPSLNSALGSSLKSWRLAVGSTTNVIFLGLHFFIWIIGKWNYLPYFLLLLWGLRLYKAITSSKLPRKWRWLLLEAPHLGTMSGQNSAKISWTVESQALVLFYSPSTVC